MASVTTKSAMTPSRMGRTTSMLSGERPSMSYASWPTATIVLSRGRMATTEGSCMTMPRPLTWTSTLTVPRSIPMCFSNMKRGDRFVQAARGGWQPEQAVPQCAVAVQPSRASLACKYMPVVRERPQVRIIRLYTRAHKPATRNRALSHNRGCAATNAGPGGPRPRPRPCRRF